MRDGVTKSLLASDENSTVPNGVASPTEKTIVFPCSIGNLPRASVSPLPPSLVLILQPLDPRRAVKIRRIQSRRASASAASAVSDAAASPAVSNAAASPAAAASRESDRRRRCDNNRQNRSARARKKANEAKTPSTAKNRLLFPFANYIPPTSFFDPFAKRGDSFLDRRRRQAAEREANVAGRGRFAEMRAGAKRNAGAAQTFAH